MAGEAAVAHAHDSDRAGRGERLVEQAPGGLVGLGQDPGHHRRVGEPGAHGRGQLRLAGAGRDLEVKEPGDAVELLGGDRDLGELRDGRTERPGVAERGAEATRPGDGAVRAGDGEPEPGKGGQALAHALAVESGPGGLGQHGRGGRQADHGEQLGKLQGPAVEQAQGGGQRRWAAGAAGQLRERRGRGRGEQVGPALEQPCKLRIAEHRQRRGVAGHAIASSWFGIEPVSLGAARRSSVPQSRVSPASGMRWGDSGTNGSNMINTFE